MDDFVTANLHESRNEWCARLVSIFSPLVIEGFKSIFDESWKLCIENDEINKYLMTYQELLTRIPKWNNEIISNEKKRIIERSGCNYLEDLISCVHIIQLKLLTCVRVGNKQKKIDISIPKLDDFIHKVYIQCARKIYSNVYLFEKNINPLQIQKNNRELELIVQECLMISIRDSIPTEEIIRAYTDESVEEEEQVIIESIPTAPEINTSNNDIPDDLVVPSNEPNLEEPVVPAEKESVELGITDLDDERVVTKLSFNDMDSVLDTDNKITNIDAPKDIERLEQISTTRALERRLEDENDEDDDEILNIGDEIINLDDFEDVSSIVKVN
tara:strand:+ start:1790 stop:2776 length:987 start_codon:yes stop_codon:yes gene_type:complete